MTYAHRTNLAFATQISLGSLGLGLAMWLSPLSALAVFGLAVLAQTIGSWVFLGLLFAHADWIPAQRLGSAINVLIISAVDPIAGIYMGCAALIQVVIGETALADTNHALAALLRR